MVPMPPVWGREGDPPVAVAGAAVAFSLGRIVRSNVPSTLGGTRKRFKSNQRRRRDRGRGPRPPFFFAGVEVAGTALVGASAAEAAHDRAAFRIVVFVSQTKNDSYLTDDVWCLALFARSCCFADRRSDGVLVCMEDETAASTGESSSATTGACKSTDDRMDVYLSGAGLEGRGFPPATTKQQVLVK